VVAALGSIMALGVFGLFSATTQNTGNEISTGTVALVDNDGGSAQFNVANATPGQSWTRCIKVTYNGSIPAVVRRYRTGGTGPLGPYLNVTITQGSQPGAVFPSCTGFTPDGAAPVYTGSALGSSGSTYETGNVVAPSGQAAWNPGDSLVFRTVLTLDAAAPEDAQGSTSGPYTIFWEARNEN
jgi:hypothetical protein